MDLLKYGSKSLLLFLLIIGNATVLSSELRNNEITINTAPGKGTINIGIEHYKLPATFNINTILNEPLVLSRDGYKSKLIKISTSGNSIIANDYVTNDIFEIYPAGKLYPAGLSVHLEPN